MQYSTRFWTVLNVMGPALWFLILWSTLLFGFKTRALLLPVHDQPKSHMIFRYFSALHASTLSLFTIDSTGWVFSSTNTMSFVTSELCFYWFLSTSPSYKATLDSEPITWCWFLKSPIPTWRSHMVLVRYAFSFTTASLRMHSHLQQWPC